MNHRFAALAFAAVALTSLASAPSAAPQEEAASGPQIVVIGSSVAAGWVTGREARQDLLNGWAARLRRQLEPRGRTLINASVPGNDIEAVLERIEGDLLALKPRYAIVGLSMANEGLETGDPGEVFASYEEGIGEILERCREEEIQPVVGLCYPCDNYNEEQYEVLEEMNLLLQSWSVPTVDFLGPLDDGHGNFVRGCTFDLGHPDALARLETRIAVAADEPRWSAPDRLEPVVLDPKILARYVGDYETNPQMTLFVTLERGRLILSRGGQGQTELHAASETEFYLRVMGPPRIPVVFELDDEGKVTGLLFDEGPYQLSARRIGQAE